MRVRSNPGPGGVGMSKDATPSADPAPADGPPDPTAATAAVAVAARAEPATERRARRATEEAELAPLRAKLAGDPAHRSTANELTSRLLASGRVAEAFVVLETELDELARRASDGDRDGGARSPSSRDVAHQAARHR